MGRPGASAQEVQDAATSANAHKFISNLPEGYMTQVQGDMPRVCANVTQGCGHAIPLPVYPVSCTYESTASGGLTAVTSMLTTY
eukprot:1137065-Pelagomonas_calceolata.AAC.7